MKSKTNTLKKFCNTRSRKAGGSSDVCLDGECGARGFTILETVIAFLLLMIVSLGVASLFTFSIYNNSGGIDRASSLSIGQQTLEVLRNAQFTSAATSTSLKGGTYVQNVVRDQRRFTLTIVIDDDPSTPALEVNPATTIKKITVTVRSESSIGMGWVSGSFGTVTLITERTMADG